MPMNQVSRPNLSAGGTRLAATHGCHANAHWTDVCSPVVHRVSPSWRATPTRKCTPCLACRDAAVKVCETCTSARRDDMVVERSQEHARPCGAMTSAGHVCMIAHPHVCTSCTILPLTSYMCVWQCAKHTTHCNDAWVRHTTSASIEWNDMMNYPRPKVASEIWSAIWPKNLVHLLVHANAFSVSVRTCGDRERE